MVVGSLLGAKAHGVEVQAGLQLLAIGLEVSALGCSGSGELSVERRKFSADALMLGTKRTERSLGKGDGRGWDVLFLAPCDCHEVGQSLHLVNSLDREVGGYLFLEGLG